MSNVPTPTRTVKVVALLSAEPDGPTVDLIDQPLTLETLPLLQPVSPLSRMLLDGAGMEWRPKAIAVFVDGKRVWTKECHERGPTDFVRADRRTNHREDIPVVTFTDAFDAPADGTLSLDDYDYWDERLADARTVSELLRNDYQDRDDAENWAADVCEAAGSQRPILQPSPPEPESTEPHAPCPCPTPGKCDVTLGLPYHAAGSWRLTHTDNAGPHAHDDVEFRPIGK